MTLCHIAQSNPRRESSNNKRKSSMRALSRGGQRKVFSKGNKTRIPPQKSLRKSSREPSAEGALK
jgi:hypothetical protein